MRAIAEHAKLARGLFSRDLATASPLLIQACMSRSAHAFGLGPDDTGSTHNDADDSGEHTILTATTRLAPFELDAVLEEAEAACGANDNHDAESTLTVSAEENMRLLSKAFRNTDDEITLEAPAVPVPNDVPSPLGDEPALPPVAPALSLLESPYAIEDETTRGYESVPDLPLLAPEALIGKVSGIRPSVTPERAKAIRDAREAARIIREEEAKTRLIVLAIWGAAVTLAGLLAFFALTP